MTPKADVIAALYRQVAAPDYAAPNLDALSDVLRDLSWLPEGPVRLELPDLSALSVPDRDALLRALAYVVTDTIDSARPVRLA